MLAYLEWDLVFTLPTGCCREDAKATAGRPERPTPLYNTWGQRPTYKKSKLMSTPNKAKETPAIFNKSLWSDMLNILCLEFMADKAFLNYITLQTFNFSKPMQKPASSGSLLIRKGSSANSRLLEHMGDLIKIYVAQVPGPRPQQAPTLAACSLYPGPLPTWPRPQSLLNPGKGANTCRAQVVDTRAVIYLWKRFSHANFNSFKRKDEIMWTLAKNI